MRHRFKQVDRAAALPQNRLPLPPRTPPVPLSEHRAISRRASRHPEAEPPASATVPKAPRHPSREPLPSIDLPVEFWPEEPASFDRRLTPVVPALWPENRVPPVSQGGPAAKLGADQRRARPSRAWPLAGQLFFLVIQSRAAIVVMLCKYGYMLIIRNIRNYRGYWFGILFLLAA